MAQEKKCSVCGKPMSVGYYVEFDEYYCSDDCLHSVYSKLQYKALNLGIDIDSKDDKTLTKLIAERELLDDSEYYSFAYYTEWNSENI